MIKGLGITVWEKENLCLGPIISFLEVHGKAIKFTSDFLFPIDKKNIHFRYS